MRLSQVTLLLLLSMACASAAKATTLPDACGDDKVKFDVVTQKGKPAPAAPDPDKAQIVFVETMKMTGLCLGCEVTTRVGLDGSWVGANKGASYFTVAVDPGEHHLCADWQSVFGRLKKKVGMAAFTAEAGKVYYYEVKVTRLTVSDEYTNYDLGLTQLSDDEGKYRLKISRLSQFAPHS
jgi:hypothetical protein